MIWWVQSARWETKENRSESATSVTLSERSLKAAPEFVLLSLSQKSPCPGVPTLRSIRWPGAARLSAVPGKHLMIFLSKRRSKMGKCSLWISNGSGERRTTLRHSESLLRQPSGRITNRERRWHRSPKKKAEGTVSAWGKNKTFQGSCGQRVPAGKALMDSESHP